LLRRISVALLAALTLAAAPAAEGALRGPDVSSYQGVVNWRAVKASGADFAFAKATEGTGYHDRQFPRNWGQMQHEGLVRGAYDFGRPAPWRSGATEARYFTAYVNANGGFRHSFAVLDMEAQTGMSQAALRRWIVDWISEVRRTAQGEAGIAVYTGAWFWTPHVGAWSPPGAALWISAYGSRPVLPAGWRGWDFWQFTDGVYGPQPHSTPGIGRGDINVFSGSRSRLLGLAGHLQSHAYASRTLRVGSLGTDVRGFQNALNKRLHARRLQRVHVDGVYGPKTETAKHRIEYRLGFPLGAVKRHGATGRAQQFLAHPEKRPASYSARAVYRAR
jgi:GH25 family lysozyme M1 (1,4-beta-N-acetylmuramidase)